MGWSCSAKASMVEQAISDIMKRAGASGSNSIVVDGVEVGFWENSRREHADGAITGSVWRYIAPGNTHVRRAGSFRIDGDGSIDRFPLLPKAVVMAAKKAALG